MTFGLDYSCTEQSEPETERKKKKLLKKVMTGMGVEGRGQGEHFSGTVLTLGQYSSAVTQDFGGWQWLWHNREWLSKKGPEPTYHNICLWICTDKDYLLKEHTQKHRLRSGT